jgi:hypothetical protein
MVYDTTYHLLFGTALLLTLGSVISGALSGLFGDDMLALVLGLLGTVSWWLVAFFSLNVEAASGGTTVQFQMPTVSLWALMVSVLPLYIAIKGPFTVIQRRVTGDAEDI